MSGSRRSLSSSSSSSSSSWSSWSRSKRTCGSSSKSNSGCSTRSGGGSSSNGGGQQQQQRRPPPFTATPAGLRQWRMRQWRMRLASLLTAVSSATARRSARAWVAAHWWPRAKPRQTPRKSALSCTTSQPAFARATSLRSLAASRVGRCRRTRRRLICNATSRRSRASCRHRTRVRGPRAAAESAPTRSSTLRHTRATRR